MKPILRTALFALLCFAAASPADEEEFVPWRTLTLDCGTIQKAGAVTLKASADAGDFKSFEVAAFDQTHRLADAELKQLSGFPLDSLRVTHSAGYASVGGHGVYFKFRRTFYDGDKKLHVQEITVAVHENHKVTIAAPREIKN